MRRKAQNTDVAISSIIGMEQNKKTFVNKTEQNVCVRLFFFMLCLYGAAACNTICPSLSSVFKMAACNNSVLVCV